METTGTDQSELVSEEERVEQDDLNTHEVMATLTQLLTHMERNKINPIVEEVVIFNCLLIIASTVFYFIRALNLVRCHHG